MKTPIKIRYILLIVLVITAAVMWARTPYSQRVALLQQASAENNYANTFTGNYLAGYIASKRGDWEKAAELFDESRKLAPKNAALLENTYTFKLLMGEVDEAIDLARKHPDSEVASAVSVILRALDAMKAKEYKRSEQLLEKIMPGEVTQVSVGTVIAPFLLAWTNLGEGRAKDGIALLRDIEGRSLAGPVVNYHIALMYDALGNTKKAETAYKKSLSEDIKPYHFVLAAGHFYLRQGQPDKAKQVFENYMKTNPYSGLFEKELETLAKGEKIPLEPQPDITKGWVEVLMEGVRIAYQSKLDDDGIAYLRLVNYLDPSFPQSLMLLANHHEELEQYKQANNYYARIPVTSSFYWESQIDAARNMYKLGEQKDAERILRELSEQKPEAYAAPLELAELLREDERFAIAAEVYAQVLNRIEKPAQQHWYIYYAQGVCYEQSDQWGKAEDAFIKALDLNPDQPDVLNYLGYSWLVQGKYVDRAQTMIEMAIAARPDDAHILDSMGWALFTSGKYHEAVDYLEQAIESMPYDATVNDHLGDLYWRLGRYKEAEYQWERALNASTPAPKSEEIKKINEKLQNGLGDSKAVASEVKQLSTISE